MLTNIHCKASDTVASDNDVISYHAIMNCSCTILRLRYYYFNVCHVYKYLLLKFTVPK